MDRRFLPLALVFLLMVAPLSAAQEQPPAEDAPEESGPVALELEAHQQGNAYFFTLAGESQRNPTLALPPSTEVTVTLRGVSGFHNIHVEGFGPSDYVSEGETTTYTFTTPASGSLEYWCDPHRSLGMVGRANIGAASSPAPDAPTEYTLVAHQEGSAFFFTIEGETRRNPPLAVPPGAEITITLKGGSGFHNIHVEGFGPSDFVTEGETTTYTFTAPETGSIEYWCDPHRSSGMVGRVTVATGAPTNGEARGPEITGPAVDLGDIGYPQCAGFMIPQSAASGEVGGPTIADYVDQCERGADAVPLARETHAADYIIPATWVLIGLGIVGVVWVNRFYKP